MLGRGVAERLLDAGPRGLFAPEVRAVMAEADLVVLNLECCISERGSRWDPARKPFHFRAPPRAVETLNWLGVDCVTLANNHALDYGVKALTDTITHLETAGIRWVGAGPDAEAARHGAVLHARDQRIAVLGVADHPSDFAAGVDRPGTAYADLWTGVTAWLSDRVKSLAAANDIVLVTPHWGPNMTSSPTRHVRRAARALLDAGATLIAGHSAHVVHGVADPVLYDLGDFIDDYVVDPVLRNDLGLLFLVDVDSDGPMRLEACPLTLEPAYTRLARGIDVRWLRSRFTSACRDLGTAVTWHDGRLVVDWR
ncbi:MAG: CapA family protein [Actinophytocola sp.]|nr:CapA family protein [Actinophytocola sp.]